MRVNEFEVMYNCNIFLKNTKLCHLTVSQSHNSVKKTLLCERF
jgi:hypothetical protein